MSETSVTSTSRHFVGQELLPCGVPISKRLALILIGTHIAAGYLFLAPSYIRPDSIAVISWLRSLVVDGDFLFFNEWAGFGMLGDGFAYFKEVTPVGALANHWWIGTSMVTAPFYLVSHSVSALLIGDLFPADGFFGLDLATACWTSVLFHALTITFALLAIRRIRDPHLRDCGFTVTALVCISLGTPAFWYTFRMPIGTHAAGMMLVGLLTYLCIRVEQENNNREKAWDSPLVLGLILGLAIATRIQHFVIVPAVLYALLATRRPLREFAVVAVGAALPLLVQGSAWFVVYGNPLGPIAAGAHLDGVTWMPFRRLAFLPVLLSSWRGLFVWSPVWAPAILGWILLARDSQSQLRRRAGVICLLLFAGELFANATLDRYWWGGMSFGPRRFVDLTLPAAIGLWAFLGRFRLKGLIATTLATAWSVLLMISAAVGTINLSRYVSWGDLVRGIRLIGTALSFEQLHSPITSPLLAIQSVIAILIIGLVSAALWHAFSARPRAAGRLVLVWVMTCLLVTLSAGVPTRSKAEIEANRFNVRGKAALSVGPLIEQRGLISDELVWLEATGQQREAERTRHEIAQINKNLSELGGAP